MVVVFCESCCGLPSFWRMMNRTRSSTCVLEGGAIDRWPTEAPQRPQPVRRQTTGARAADSRTRYSWLLKLRAAPCRACSASSRSSGRRAPPSPSPATSSGWLNLEWPRVRCSASSATERCVRPRARAGLSSAPATAGWHLPGRTRLPRAGSSGPSAACTQAYGHGHVTVAR